MGCTAELLAFYASDYVIGHVGDSRTYLFRQGELRHITRDHSWVRAQIDQGLLTPAEAQRSPLRKSSSALSVRKILWSLTFYRERACPVIFTCSVLTG